MHMLSAWTTGSLGVWTCLVFAILHSANGRVAVTLGRCSGPKHQKLWVTFTLDRLKQTKHGPKRFEPTTRQIY